MSTLDTESTYCLGFMAEQGANDGDCQEFDFTTASGPPSDPTQNADIAFDDDGLTIVFDEDGFVITQ